MITLREAKKIAEGWLSDIDCCVEYTDAYCFQNRAGAESFGGPDAPVIVMKEDGRIMGTSEYFDRTGAGEEVRVHRFRVPKEREKTHWVEFAYVEPVDYIPKEIRKKYGLGEYNEEFNKPKKKGTPGNGGEKGE